MTSPDDALCLRPLKLEDVDITHRWRSDKRVYRYFYRAKAPARGEHEAWIRWVLSTEESPRCFIVEHIEHGPVGFCSFDPRDWFLGIYIGPEFHRRGYGQTALRMLMARAREAGITQLRAKVHPANLAAQRLYASVGFKMKWLTMAGKTGGKHGA